MGKRGGKKFRQGNGRPRVSNNEVNKTNEKFERFYNSLDLVPVNEREEFWEALRSDLPMSFRFAGSKGHALTVQQHLINQYIPEIIKIKFEDREVDPPKQVPWYPANLAWSMNTPKNVIRKFPPFQSFQKFLVSETSIGNISRQELVSMIPPLLMDIKPGMVVLDLCAAPGSKSAQLIEMVHSGEEARIRGNLRRVAKRDGREVSPAGVELVAEELPTGEEDYLDDGRSTGLLIANDKEYRRANMLIHQMKRLNSPNIIVTNHDASIFPSIKLPGGKGKYLKFDRILADVPCSGDATSRKNLNVWRDWVPGNGLGLHTMQVRILIRALEMLKVGGRVVYSTCSMNPVENEAVIATAIDRCGGLGKIAMIDCSNELPGLVRLPGKFDWKVMDKSGKIWNRWDEVEAANARGETDGTDRLIEGMFPPAASTEGHAIPFDRCMRVYPHLQDTGGFFITVLEKLSEIRTRPENITKNKNNGTSAYGANAENDEQNTTAKPAIGQILHAVESDMSKEEDSKESQPMQALDDVLPLETDGGTDVSSGNAPAAARSNQPNAGVLVQADGKRFAEDELIPDMPAKRAKMEPVPAGGAPNTEHWPLPPAMGVDQTVETSEVRNGEDIVAKSKPKPNQQHEEPFKYLDPDHEELQSIYSFYQLSDRFPRDRFMVRNATGQPVKAIYYTSALARDILTEMEGKGMKFVHCGIKMFVKQDPQKENICRWRIQAEGLPVIEHWVGENRVVRLYKRDTLQKLLKEMFPKIGQNDWQSLGEIGPRVKDMEMGCCVLRVEPSDEVDGDGFRERMVLPLWRSAWSLNLMLPKDERQAMLLRLFNDTSPLINTQDRLKKPDPEESRSPSPLKVGSSEPGEASESLFVTNGTYDAARHPNVEEATTIMGLVEPDASEEVALDDENRLLAAAQQEADNTREVAPGVTDEDDVFNQTV